MIFVADENFSPRLVRVLEAFDRESEIRHLLDLFPRGSDDLDWIAGLATSNPKPVIVGGDGRILRNAAERAALRTSGLSFVYLAKGWANTGYQEQAWKIVKAWPAIVRNVEQVLVPTVFEVRVGSSLKIERRWTTSQL